MSQKAPANNQDNSSEGTTRRELFHIANALAVPVVLGGLDAKAATGSLKTGPQIYQSIGVEPVINCRGTFTIIGASIELPEVRAAMEAASQHYVQLDELADAVGRRLAELTGAEWGMVSAGCAAGLKHVTAACVAGGNPEKLIRIPDLTGLDKTEVVIPRSFEERLRSRGSQHRRQGNHSGHGGGVGERLEFPDCHDLPYGRRSIPHGTPCVGCCSQNGET